VQFTALSSQSNTPLPETYSAFNGGFAWANLQFDYGFFAGLSTCVPTLTYHDKPTESEAESHVDFKELASQIGIKPDGEADGTKAFLASKGVSAAENFAGNALSMILVMGSMLAAHGLAIWYWGKGKLTGMLAFPKLELVVGVAFFQGLVLSAVAGIRLESCNAAVVFWGTIVMMWQIASGALPIWTVYKSLIREHKLEWHPTTPTERKEARNKLVEEMKEIKKQLSEVNMKDPKQVKEFASYHSKQVEDAYAKLNTFGGYNKPDGSSDGAKFLNTHGELFAGYTMRNWWFCFIIWADKSIAAIFTSGVPGLSQTVLNWLVCFLVWAVLCVRCPHTTIYTNANMIINRSIQMFSLFFLMIGATTNVDPMDISVICTCFNLIGTAHLLVEQMSDSVTKTKKVYKLATSPEAQAMVKEMKVEIVKLEEKLEKLSPRLGEAIHKLSPRGSPRDNQGVALVTEDAAKRGNDATALSRVKSPSISQNI